MKWHKYLNTQGCVNLSGVSYAEPSENQISAHQVIGANIPETPQHADSSIQKIQSRWVKLSTHVRYIDPSCHILRTIQKQLHTCYMTESQWHLSVPLNCFSEAQFQPPKNPNKTRKENVCAYTHQKNPNDKHTQNQTKYPVKTQTLMLQAYILFFERV